METSSQLKQYPSSHPHECPQCEIVWFCHSEHYIGYLPKFQICPKNHGCRFDACPPDKPAETSPNMDRELSRKPRVGDLVLYLGKFHMITMVRDMWTVDLMFDIGHNLQENIAVEHALMKKEPKHGWMFPEENNTYGVYDTIRVNII